MGKKLAPFGWRTGFVMAAAGAIVAVAALPAAANPANLSWSVADVPAAGATSITFPLTIEAATSENMYYASNQFYFANNGGGAYIGLQPTSNSASGAHQFTAIFSNFVAGSTTSDPNCHVGADGGAGGASCLIQFPSTLGTTYDLNVTQSGSTWTGTVTGGGENVHIGSWTVPTSAGVTGTGISWVERYTGGTIPPCNAQTYPFFEATFGNPVANGNLTGTRTIATENGRCQGMDNFSSSQSSAGTTVQFGFTI